MFLHHLGWVGRDGATLHRRFNGESVAELTPPITDPVQKVIVQFFRDRVTGAVWETIIPADTVESSPLASRLARGGGLDHACYELEATDGTLEQVLEDERAQGSRVTVAPVMAAAFDRRIAFVLRRSGRLIEFVEARTPGAVV
ncbi:MAG: hypothetical protein HUU27_11110 [Phycisphaerae bacterium]|nr:hypothetical protein [Phycisphaerae bacterium]